MASIVTCYVGCNTGSPDLQAIHVLRCDSETGKAEIVQSVKGIEGTTYFVLSNDGRSLYSIVGDERNKALKGKCVRFPVEESTGRLGAMEEIAELPSPAPCHVTLSPDGKLFAFANYGCGIAGVVDLATREVRSVTLSNEGVGPNRLRQQKAYAHFVFFTPDGKRLGVINLGCDRIHFFDPATMVEDVEKRILAEPGEGPRHAVWSKDNRRLFVVNELASSVASYAYDGQRFTRTGVWSMLIEGAERFAADGETLATKAAAIKLSADGKLLVASNRGHDSLAFFEVAEDGTLERKLIAPLTGRFPRDFAFLPGEKFIVVGHKLSDEVCLYAFDRAAMTLTPVGSPISIWKPLCFKAQ